MKKKLVLIVFVATLITYSCKKEDSSDRVLQSTVTSQQVLEVAQKYNLSVSRIDESKLNGVSYQELTNLILLAKFNQVLFIKSTGNDLNNFAKTIESDIKSNNVKNCIFLKSFIDMNRQIGSTITRNEVITNIQNDKNFIQIASVINKQRASASSFSEDLDPVTVVGYIPSDNGISLVDWYNLINSLQLPTLGTDGGISDGGGTGSSSLTGGGAASLIPIINGHDPNFVKGKTPYTSSIPILKARFLQLTGLNFNFGYTLNSDGSINNVPTPQITPYGLLASIDVIGVVLNYSVSGSVITWSGSGTLNYYLGTPGFNIPISQVPISIGIVYDTSNGNYSASVK